MKILLKKFASFLLFFALLLGSVSFFSGIQTHQVFAQSVEDEDDDRDKQNEFEIPFAQKTDSAGVSLGQQGQGDDVIEFSLISIDEGEGTSGLREIVNRVITFIELVLGGFGVLYIVIAGYRLLVAGSKIDEIITKEKETIQWIVVGFVVVAIADIAVDKVFFAKTGEFLATKESAIQAARYGADQIRSIVNYFVAFVGTIAVLAIVIAGMRMLLSPGNDEVVESQKRVALWAALGLIIISLADRVVFIFYNEGGTQGVNVQAGLVELTGLANYILGFLGVIAAASLVYAGILMISNYGNTEAVDKAKTIVKDVVLGIIIAFSSYTIISAVVRIAQ